MNNQKKPRLSGNRRYSGYSKMIFLVSKNAFAKVGSLNVKIIQIGAFGQKLKAIILGASVALPPGASVLRKWTKWLIISERKLRFERFFYKKKSSVAKAFIGTNYNTKHFFRKIAPKSKKRHIIVTFFLFFHEKMIIFCHFLIFFLEKKRPNILRRKQKPPKKGALTPSKF